MKAPRERLRVRPLLERDAAVISQAFRAVGMHKSVHQFEQYLAEQQQSIRQCWVAHVDGRFAGYVTLHWNPLYPGIAGKGVPEIQDLNVLPSYRRQGIATRLLDRAEQSAAARATSVAVGVGLLPGDSAAQRLYGRRGYIPDGLGVTYEDRFVEAGELVRFDHELVLHLIKPLRQQSASFSSASRLGAAAAAASVLRSLERRGNVD
ncbi:MAG TPA: GNAT family N-acetyltransferase [Polyangiaceae bacterium]|jgi:GNAT superfamily N-acetyltransferase|nr:GNAT family N-acetyltransferase [Polyangiaceae bacterium]